MGGRGARARRRRTRRRRHGRCRKPPGGAACRRARRVARAGAHASGLTGARAARGSLAAARKAPHAASRDDLALRAHDDARDAPRTGLQRGEARRRRHRHPRFRPARLQRAHLRHVSLLRPVRRQSPHHAGHVRLRGRLPPLSPSRLRASDQPGARHEQLPPAGSECVSGGPEVGARDDAAPAPAERPRITRPSPPRPTTSSPPGIEAFIAHTTSSAAIATRALDTRSTTSARSTAASAASGTRGRSSSSRPG
jgi:hypothetical protein